MQTQTTAPAAEGGLNIRFIPAPNSPWRVLPDTDETPTTVSLTVLESRRIELRKVWRRQRDGHWPAKPEASADSRQFRRHVRPVPYGDCEALHELIARIASNPRCCIVHGQPVDTSPAYGPRRKHGRPGQPATLSEQPTWILWLDLDDLTIPDADVVQEPGLAVAAAVDRLGPPFTDASYVWWFSGGQRPDSDRIKLRLGFFLDRPHTTDELRRWAKTAPVPVDSSIYNAVQIIYTANPQFLDALGADLPDWLPRRSGYVLNEQDTITLTIPPTPATATPTPPPADGVQRRDPAVLRPLVQAVANAADGQKHAVLNTAAFAAGGYVAGGAVTLAEATDALRAAIARKPNVADLDAAFQTIDRAIQDGHRAPLYAPSDTDANPEPEPDAEPLLGEKSDIEADLSRLTHGGTAEANARARAILRRYCWQSPQKRTFTELAELTIAALPTGANPAIPGRLRRYGAWLEQQARRRAVAGSSVDPAVLAPARIGYERRDRVDASIAAMIAADPSALWLIKAPHGTGKTESILKPLARLPGTVLALTHRVSLVSNLCQRLNLDNYQTIETDEVPACTELGICLPSLINERFLDFLGRTETLLIDEVSAVLRETYSTTGVLKKNGPATARTLGVLLDQARIAVAVDADLSTQDILTLARLTRRPIRVIEVATTPQTKTIRHSSADRIKQAILDAAAAGEKIRIACDSSRAVIELAELLRARFPQLRVLDVQSAPGSATSGTPAVEALLASVNERITDIDILLHSPTIESGLSIEVPHFTRTFGLFCGRSIGPAGFLQMLARDRTATLFEVGLAGIGKANAPTDAGLILANLDATHRRTVSIAREEGGYSMRFSPATAWDERSVEYAAARNVDTNDSHSNLLLLAEARGWTVERQTDAPGLPPEAQQEARELAIERYETEVLDATDLTPEQAADLKRQYQPGPWASAALEKFSGAEGDGLQKEQLDTDTLRLHARGALHGWNRRIDRLQEALLAGLNDDADDDRALALRRNRLAHAEAARTLFEICGFDPTTGDGEIDADGALEAWRNLRDSPCRPALESDGITVGDREPKYPIRWLAQALGKFGLWLESDGQRAQRRYRIGRGIKTSADGLTVTAPGWDAMQTIRERRARMGQEHIYKGAICETAPGPRRAQTPQEETY